LTGFGAAIVMMIFLPQLFPIAQSAAVAGVIMAASVLTLVWRNRHHIHLRQIIIPFIVCERGGLFGAFGSGTRRSIVAPLVGGTTISIGIIF